MPCEYASYPHTCLILCACVPSVVHYEVPRDVRGHRLRLSEANQGIRPCRHTSQCCQFHATQCSTVCKECGMHCSTIIEHDAHMRNVSACLLVFCTGGPRTRNIRTYFIWYGHCRAASADSFGCFVRPIPNFIRIPTHT